MRTPVARDSAQQTPRRRPRHLLFSLLTVSLLGLPLAPGATAGPPPEPRMITLAGGSHGDGLPAPDASLSWPRGLAAGAGGIYIADFFHHQVRLVRPDGTIHRVAGTVEGISGDNGPAIAARLNRPMGLDLDEDGNLFIADGGNHRIRRVDAETGVITTVAGTGQRTFSGDGGPARTASVAFPKDVAAGTDGSVYIADYENLRVRRVAPDGTISTFAGNGTGLPGVDGVPATLSPIDAPSGVAVGPDGNVYIADEGNCAIRMVDDDGNIHTVAGGNSCGFSGDGGPATDAQIDMPQQVDVAADGSIWIADRWNGRVRVVGADGVIRTVAGGGNESCPSEPTADPALSNVWATAVDADGTGYVALSSLDCSRVYRIGEGGEVSVLAGNRQSHVAKSGAPASSLDLGILAAAWSPDGEPWFASPGSIWRVDAGGRAWRVAGYEEAGDVDGPAEEARFQRITDIAFADDGSLWIADGGGRKLKRLADGVVTTMAGTGEYQPGAGDGPALETTLYYPYDVAPMPDGSVYFGDGGERLRILRDGQIETLNTPECCFDGDGEHVSKARFRIPAGLDLAPDGSLAIADYWNRRVRRMSADGIMSTVAGDGAWNGERGDGTLAVLATLDLPEDVAVGPDGSMFIAQSQSSVVRMVSPNGMITRLAGTGQSGNGPDGPASKTPLVVPLSVDAGPGGLLIADGWALKLVEPVAGEWPHPAREVVCLPMAPDAPGDARPEVTALFHGPNKPWLDILEADVDTRGGALTATLKMNELTEAAYAPPGYIGGANAWTYVVRLPGDQHYYVAAIAPVTLQEPGSDEMVHYEYGTARFLSGSGWTLVRQGSTTGTFDMAKDEITISAPLDGLGLRDGDFVEYQEAGGGHLVETGVTRHVTVHDEAPDGAVTRSFTVGRNCPEDY